MTFSVKDLYNIELKFYLLKALQMEEFRKIFVKKMSETYHYVIYTFCFNPYYILLPRSFPYHENMNTDDTPLQGTQ
jgi:hypothetical protein